MVLMATTYPIFLLLMPVAGERAAYFVGFALYWLLGGIVFPILLIGRDGVSSLFARQTRAVSFRLALALVLLATPVVIGFLCAFPSIVPVASGATVAGLVVYAIVNGTWSTGAIHWTVLSHVLTNMSGLGAMLVCGPGW